MHAWLNESITPELLGTHDKCTYLVTKMTESPCRKRRARHDIIIEILRVAENGVKKTKIMYKASLSFDQLKQYLNALRKENLITEESGIWKTNEKGLHVIEACKICQRLLTEVP